MHQSANRFPYNRISFFFRPQAVVEAALAVAAAVVVASAAAIEVVEVVDGVAVEARPVDGDEVRREAGVRRGAARAVLARVPVR